MMDVEEINSIGATNKIKEKYNNQHDMDMYSYLHLLWNILQFGRIINQDKNFCLWNN